MSSKDVSRWNKVKMLFFLSGGGLVYSIYLGSEMGDDAALAAFLFGLSFVLMVLLQILDKDKDDEEPKKSGVPDGPTLCLWVSFVSFAFGVLVLSVSSLDFSVTINQKMSNSASFNPELMGQNQRRPPATKGRRPPEDIN